MTLSALLPMMFSEGIDKSEDHSFAAHAHSCVGFFVGLLPSPLGLTEAWESSRGFCILLT